jgi:hypothetical protein
MFSFCRDAVVEVLSEIFDYASQHDCSSNMCLWRIKMFSRNYRFHASIIYFPQSLQKQCMEISLYTFALLLKLKSFLSRQKLKKLNDFWIVNWDVNTELEKHSSACE